MAAGVKNSFFNLSYLAQKTIFFAIERMLRLADKTENADSVADYLFYSAMIYMFFFRKIILTNHCNRVETLD